MLHIVHLNDTEGKLEDVWPRVATATRSLREAGRCDLLLHAGDIPLDTAAPCDSASVMNQLGFDAFALGNHDLGRDDAALAQHLEALSAPVLCANVSGAPEGFFRPYCWYQLKGMQVAVIGVTLHDFPRYLRQRRTAELTFQSPVKVLQDLIPRLRSRADLIVVLSHCGSQADMELARQAPGIDLIVGGHDHALLPEPVLVGRTWVAQAGAEGACVGTVTVSWCSSQLEVTGRLLPTADLPPDADILSLLPSAALGAAMLEVAGYTATDLRSRDYARETPLGNLTVDLMRAYAGTDLALLRCASVVNDLPAGPIRRRDLQRLNTCGEDQVARLELSGRELVEVLESGVRGASTSPGRSLELVLPSANSYYFLLVTAGARVVYDAERPEGQRVVSVQVGDEPLDLQRSYTVACTEVLANGTGGFPVLGLKPRELLPSMLEDVLAEHIATEGTIRPVIDGRLDIGGRLPSECLVPPES